MVLAGGRGSRLGGVDKAGIELGGERLVDRAVGAARAAGAELAVVAGPDSARVPGALLVREDPPFTGPLAALAAALPSVRADWLLLLSCDLVHPERVCAALLAEAAVLGKPGEAEMGDGILLRDENGRAQWLAGLYRTAALREGLRRLRGGPEHAPLRLVFGELRLREVEAPPSASDDIDAPEDLARARAAEPAPLPGASPPGAAPPGSGPPGSGPPTAAAANVSIPADSEEHA
ncbi:molybdenum cofactor guanylyltransferase [Leucobacter massiliensis]|uniref:molybdenum cofactor guanylyltransferase n=1 Tax=Leucobacter massiliensis TaxID=1686285 RepID=UPI0015E34C24|nr:NTP transferase domain-containing protein [Leucobacter massiliensis]